MSRARSQPQSKGCNVESYFGPDGKVYGVVPVHGEGASVYHVVDVSAPEAEQPAILAIYRERWQAQNRAIAGCSCPINAHYYGAGIENCERSRAS